MLTKTKSPDVDKYIARFPKETQVVLKKLRQMVRKMAPKAVESISYGMPAYKLNGKPLVYFGGWKTHVGFYPTPSGTSAFKKELMPYKVAKGSARFLLEEAIPYALIEKIVRFRVKECSVKQSG